MSTQMAANGDAIARVVLDKFNTLPKKRKPQAKPNGMREWVPLSGIVSEHDGQLTCIALGYFDFHTEDAKQLILDRTGMKCLPANKVSSASGIILHDSHAEIICVRAFNHFLLSECHSVISGRQSAYIQTRQPSPSQPQPFAVQPGIILHMYNSEAPCGDASMELVMASQADATPWTEPSISSETHDPSTLLGGRAYFSHLGIVRRKPSRPDAPATLSKSCSDKLAMYQFTSLLSAVASLIISPQNVYLKSIVLPHSQYSTIGCNRAFTAEGRMKAASLLRINGDYKWHPSQVLITNLDFQYSRVLREEAEKISPSNLAAVWNPYIEESLIGGVLQGRKVGDIKGASAICRRRLWSLARQVADLLDGTEDSRAAAKAVLSAETYREIKTVESLKNRREVKDLIIRHSLQGWIRNVEDDFQF